MLPTVLIILLILAVVGGLPNISGHGYGWAPSGGLGLIVIILVVLLLMGRL